MADALCDMELVRQHVDDDPECIFIRVSDKYFPTVDSGKDGTVYQWQLGWHVSACEVAKLYGHPEIFEVLMEQSPADEKLLNACWMHEEALVNSVLAAHPDVAETLPPAGKRHLAHGARNNDTAAAFLMLAAGLPVDRFGQHHATALHWAAWHGNVELVRLILVMRVEAYSTQAVRAVFRRRGISLLGRCGQ
jgi:hypothetical protein